MNTQLFVQQALGGLAEQTARGSKRSCAGGEDADECGNPTPL